MDATLPIRTLPTAVFARLAVDGHSSELTLRQMAVLTLAAEADEPPSVLELAATLNMPKPSMSRSIDRLEVEGLAVRKLHPVDRRKVAVVLTDAGRALVRRIEVWMREPAHALEAA